MSKSLRIIFMGTPAFAVAGLRSIIKSHHSVVAIVTAPDRPAGRGKKMQFSAVKEEALAHGIPLLQPEKLNDTKTIEEIIAFNADVFVVVALGCYPSLFGLFRLWVHLIFMPHYFHNIVVLHLSIGQ